MPNKQISQKVIDFQYSRIRSNNDDKRKNLIEEDRFSNRFTYWDLSDIIKSLNLTTKQHHLIWVGYGNNCLLQGFLYCLIQGCKSVKEGTGSQFINTKYYLYQLAQKYLTMKQQKLLVQNLCYAQYAKSVVSFLNKTHSLQDLLLKIYKSYIAEQDKNLVALQQIGKFAEIFQFLQYTILNQNVAAISNLTQKHFLVSYKQCVFIIQLGQKSEFYIPTRTDSSSRLIIQSVNQNNKVYVDQKSTLQMSTPKFINKYQGSQYKNSSSKSLYQNKFNKHQKNKQGKMIESVSGFSQQQDFEKHRQKKRIEFKIQPPLLQIAQVEHKIQNLEQRNHKDVHTTNSPIQTLRNTIEAHISNLQNLKQRNKKPKNKLSNLLWKNMKNKSTFTNNYSSGEIIKSKSEENRYNAYSPKNSPSNQAFVSRKYFNKTFNHQLGNDITSPKIEYIPNGINIFRNSITNSNSIANSNINRQRVSFTYISR